MANARKRAVARVLHSQPYIIAPKPENAHAASPDVRRRLFMWIVQRRMAQIGMVACAVAAIAGWFVQGTPGLLAGLLGVYIFRDALPRADDELDKATGRKAE